MRPQERIFEEDSFAADAGNDKLKLGGCDLGNVGMTELIRENSVVQLSPGQWERAQRQFSGRMMPTEFLRWRGDYYAVGNAAVMGYGGDRNRKMGKQKFVREYYGLQIVAGIWGLTYPHLPPEISIMGAYPPADSEMAKEIVRSLKGVWVFYDLDGNKYKTKVVTVRAVDEIVGGAMNYVLLPDGGRMSGHHVLGNGETLVLDVGGGTFDVAILDEDGIPIPGTTRSARIGFRDTLEEFKLAIDREYGDLFTGQDGIPMRRVYEIALHPEKKMTQWAGDPFSFLDLWDDAVAPMLSQMWVQANDMTAGLTTAAKHVIVTGGAGDVLFNEVCSALVDKHHESGRVYRAARAGEGIHANQRGLRKIIAGLRRAK